VNAKVGDRLVIRAHHQGEPIRDGEILRVGPGGGPPFLVRWSQDGHESLFFPSSDAHVEHLEPHPPRKRTKKKAAESGEGAAR
jgi:Domain of unknown function (DUF1918)